MDYSKVLAERTRRVEFSGIRKFFEIAARLQDPCDLSLGQPDYDAPEAVKQAAMAAIRDGKNRYTPSAGLPELRAKIGAQLTAEFGFQPALMVTSGLSGGLTLALLSILDPGDEVIFLDPYFVSYVHLVNMFGGVPVPIPSYPDFAFREEAVRAAITPRTKALLLNSPGNPTGRVMTKQEVSAAARLAREHGLLLISDEIYDRLCYDGPNPCPFVEAPDNTVVLRGFGKTLGITGWRMGYAAGPAAILDEMTKLHQYTYVCAPSMAQSAVAAAFDVDVSGHARDYAKKRGLVCELLAPSFEFVRPAGGFYLFPRVPARFASGEEFAQRAMKHEVLVIPGAIFSGVDTHFRISYANSDDVLRRGCTTLGKLARGELD